VLGLIFRIMTFFSDLAAPGDHGDDPGDDHGDDQGAAPRSQAPTATLGMAVASGGASSGGASEGEGSREGSYEGGTNAKLTAMTWLKLRVKSVGLQKAVTADLAASVSDGRVLLAVLRNFLGSDSDVNMDTLGGFVATGDGEADFKSAVTGLHEHFGVPPLLASRADLAAAPAAVLPYILSVKVTNNEINLLPFCHPSRAITKLCAVCVLCGRDA